MTGRWVVTKVTDFWDPKHYSKDNNDLKEIGNSPFIYGREHITPPEVEALRPEGSEANSSGWRVRVVPNKFPALQVEGEIDYHQDQLFESSNGIGAHEVLIETPEPQKQMADFSDEEMLDVMNMYQRRVIDLSGDQRFKYVIIFKNYGKSAGATIAHAHSQVIALPMIPKYVLDKLNGAKEYFNQNKRNIYEDILAQEMKERERIVTENEDYLCFCPFVSRYAFETWIMPKKSESIFSELKKDGLNRLALILKDTLGRIRQLLDDPSLNFYLQLKPVNSDYDAPFLWHIEIVPKLTPFAEFDRDAGFYIVQTPPHLAAQYLREAASSVPA